MTSLYEMDETTAFKMAVTKAVAETRAADDIYAARELGWEAKMAYHQNGAIIMLLTALIAQKDGA